MKYIKKITILLVLISVMFNVETVFAAESKDLKKDIAQFHYSVMNESGYITCAIDITEKQNDKFKLDIIFKENINGISLGFYVSPYILQFMEVANMEYDSGFEGSYLYTIGSGEYNSLEELSTILSRLPFVDIEGDGNEFYADIDLTIWDEERKEDNFVDDIYKTNTFIFSYKPLKKMDTNASNFENGTYIWKLKDGEITGIYAIKNSNHAGLIVGIIGIIIFAGGIFIILRNPFKNNNTHRRSKRNKKNNDDYDEYNNYGAYNGYEDYGYQDNYYDNNHYRGNY